MNHQLFLIFLIGLLYVLLLRAVSPLRREGISNQFVIEGLGVLGLLLLVMYGGGFVMHPLYALIILYVITMRVRLMVELGNQFSKIGRPQNALAVYKFALRLFPDQPSRVIVSLNIGAAYLQCQQPERAIEVLEQVKGQITHQLASKYMASCCYNLGMAYRRVGRRTEALKHFREVGEIYPLSRYARLAELAYNSTINELDKPQ